MTRKPIYALLVASLVLLAGCLGGAPGTADPATADGDQAEDPPRTDDPAAPNDGTVAFYLSDERNDIGDFRHLNVTVTQVGFERADGGGWIERDAAGATADLTELRGPNATLVGEYDLPNGTYSKVFVHVDEVNGTLQGGEDVRVKLPSGKLQLTKGFTVTDDSELDFVFDISVHKAGNSGKYVLKPVVSQSGTDVPIETTGEGADDEVGDDEGDDAEDGGDERDDRDAEDGRLNATFLGPVVQGESVTLSVERDGSPVANATVVVNDRTVGTTDAAGERVIDVPDAESLTVTVRSGDAETELEREFESGE